MIYALKLAEFCSSLFNIRIINIYSHFLYEIIDFDAKNKPCYLNILEWGKCGHKIHTEKALDAEQYQFIISEKDR